LLFLGSAWKSPWSECTLMGWFLSVLSARAGADASRAPRHASNRRGLRFLGRGDIQACDVVTQHHAIILHIAVHADTIGAAAALDHGHRVVGAGYIGGQVHLHMFGIDDQRGAAVLV